MAQLVDTSVFVSLERRGIDLSDAPWADEPIALSSFTAAELLDGVYRADTAERRARRETFIEAALEHLEILSFDLAAARVYARVWAGLSSQGQRISVNDLIIAATALAHDFGVLTENVRDFERVPGLVVRRPDWDAASR